MPPRRLKALHLAGAAAQKAQRVLQDKPDRAVGVRLTVLRLLIRRRRRKRKEYS